MARFGQAKVWHGERPLHALLVGLNGFDFAAVADVLARQLLDVKARGGKNKLLMGYDVITGGMRIKPFKHKFEIGEMADEIFVEEGLNRRKVRVVVGADGDGAMALLKTAARKRGIAFLPYCSRHAPRQAR